MVSGNVISTKFSDKYNRDWDLRFNYGLIEDVKEKTSVDFDQLIEKPTDFSAFIFNNPRKLIEVMYVICEEQCKKYDITPKQFGYLFDRDTLDLASNALIAAIVDFYPRSAAGQPILQQLPRLMKKMDEEIMKKTNERIEIYLNNVDQ